ncbi:hypothetical protein MGN70_009849 [Eutypa lata]|nr:hypothetical protein MGN70_009849 [Eutypa lata]
MQIKAALLAGLAATSAAAQRACGAPTPTDEQIEVAKLFAEQEAAVRIAGNSTRRAAINVNVYFHVLASSTSVSGGYISASTLTQQLAAMNAAYAPYDISFTQAGADWTVNSGWAADGSELTMKRSLRKGTYADLNL